MKEFKEDLKYMALVILLLTLILMSFFSCSEDRLEIDCNCQSVETTTKAITVNGLPKIRINKSYAYYSTNCDDDGRKLNKNTIVICK